MCELDEVIRHDQVASARRVNGEVNLDFVRWQRQNLLFMSWIKSSIHPLIYPILVNESSTMAVWKNLEVKLLPRMEIY